MQQPRRASATSPQPSAPSTRLSSIPRPTVTTSFDNHMLNSQLGAPASAQASTPEALSFYGQRRQQGSSNAFASIGSSTLPDRSFDRPSNRSVSGPALNPSRSSPTFMGPEKLQRTSIRDLVAKFDQNGDANSSQGSLPQGNPSQPNMYPRKPAPPTSAGAQERPQAQRDRPKPPTSEESMTSRPRRSPVRQYGGRDGPRNPNLLHSQTPADLTRPRTADNVDTPLEQSRLPLFGEVVAGTETEAANPGHGIPHTKQRRVSEGSMHYPNAMFPNARTSYIEESPLADEPSNAPAVPNGLVSHATHGRSRSDVSGGQPSEQPSRLPIRTTRIEPGPDVVKFSTNDSTPRQPTTPPAPLSSSRNDTAPNKLSGSGQRLNAIISAPAPKVSPPLRSSRPRQDITTARPVSPTPDRDRVPPMVASPERTKLFAGVDMDLATRRNSIRKALRQDRERNMQASQTSPQRIFSRAPGNGTGLSPNPSPTAIRHPPRNAEPTPVHAPQLSSAVYSQPTPALTIKVPGSLATAPDEPGSGATQFEEDDSPTLGVPGSFPDDPNQSSDINVSDSRDRTINNMEQERKPTRTVLSQIMEMRRSDASQFASASRPSMAGSSPGDQDDAETIQIMLSDTPALNRLSAGWQSRELHYGSNQSGDVLGNTGQEYTGIQDESISSTPSIRTGTSQNERESSSTTLDKDPYYLINRILDQYRESGVVSTEMVQDFQQHFLDVDPDLSGRDAMESMTIAKAALEDIIKDHSASVSASTHLTSDTYQSGPSGEGRPYWESIDSDATITSVTFGNQQAASGTTELPTPNDSGRPTPPPKDTDFNRLSSPPVQAEAASGTDADDVSALNEISFAENRPLLPEMPSTGGNLGFLMGGISRNNSPVNANKAQAEVLQPRSTLNDHFESTADKTTSVSSQSTAGQQQIPRLSSGQHATPDIGGSQSQGIESHSRGPSLDKDHQMASSAASQASEQRRLTQRRHLLKELVDTEYSFNQDMKVIEDIYKGTASSVQALTQEDQRVLFGNSAQVVEFSEAFLDALKQASRSVYKMPRGSQWRVNPGNLSEPNSGSQTEESSLASSEATDDERDRKTFIGDAFNNYMSRMEKVYSEYLKNHDFANQRLQKLQSIAQVQLWLSECHAYANDITSAWDLDSLLVKPVQRILKYPLLLRSLLEQTPDDHPDHSALELAVKQSEDVSYRINESKKRAELLEQVVNKTPKRKDFDFSKVFSRRTDKIAHRVGLSEAVEDPDYKRLAEKFGGRYFQLQIVMRDIEMYRKKTEDFMTQFNRYISAIEELIDVGHSNSPEIESKWRKFAVTIREMTAIAYADHDNAVRKHCIEPIITLIKLHDGPQRLMQKRKKRIVEYAKFLTVKNRGDRVDKKLQEQGDQFVALNDTLKDELPKLFNLTAKLVEACLRNFVDLQSQWHSTWQKKIKNVLEEQQIPQNWADIVDAFNSDFSYTEAHVLSLGICNGSLLAETSNFLSSASSFTMTDDNSSTKRPSLVASKASPSFPQHEFKRSSDGSIGLQYASPRTSSDSQVQTSRGNGYAQYQSRYRADSNLSSHSNNAWNQSSLASPRGPATYNPAAYSSDPHQAFRYRRSTEAPTHPPQSTPPYPTTANSAPMTRQASNSARPISSSTFYSASSTTITQQESSSNTSEPRYSGLFSSAMPMSDSHDEMRGQTPNESTERAEPTVLFTAASMFEFSLDRCRKEAGYPYLNYMAGEIFNVIGEKGELWLASNQDDPTHSIGWIWEKHFAKLIN